MSPMDARIEAAAEAIWTRQAWRHHTPWGDLDREVRDEFLADARVALAAAYPDDYQLTSGEGAS